MPHALTLADMSPGLATVVERAHREPAGRFHALAHWIDVPALKRAYRRQRSDAAVGAEGVTQEQDGQLLAANLQKLPGRLKAKRYRPQPIRRVPIPTTPGKTRPIGISAFEDQVGQEAGREVVAAISEQDFLDCAYGFRPGRGAHDAVRPLKQRVAGGEVRGRCEADRVSFFASLDRTELQKRREVRGADGARWRRIGKGWHVGVLDGEA
jgi:RNA-directed DNA polymerase